MLKQFCDLCKEEIKGKRLEKIEITYSEDLNPNRLVDFSHVIRTCKPCLSKIETFIDKMKE